MALCTGATYAMTDYVHVGTSGVGNWETLLKPGEAISMSGSFLELPCRTYSKVGSSTVLGYSMSAVEVYRVTDLGAGIGRFGAGVKH